ncbi:Uncharacterised protein [Mycobacteroides abscessus subsp. massiliense]|uniref:hypothetical protein n=1 Tax=Mycobacteroides abscessus TaxID=36809 RepID=UPI0009A7ECA1|nr:hypothetical protein [Mycobacteroides abscessus]SKM81321.1 Uncharacterised protein [Mycobacteroides abscessus subsp. massiliense]SKM97746.1 Uncharacterised protein [Mycobacteroides abscessus subsp. massiliense]SKN76722.1 Uncharacterised protein [Mycobacteroides abscessus subsp. massiliense]SKN96407.1 Uncharacterised protein [Mycobacteroides abscessus subsp. massiliense]SKO21560.1 Uncharacterised protein [Mycobacteroides abscessus subsp. massiliense]
MTGPALASPESFTVSYDAWAGVADRVTDPDNEPDIRPVTATMLFRYRVPAGWAFRAPNYNPRPTDFALDTFTARLDEGQLKQLDGTLNLKLIANTPLLGWTEDLYIDISFTNVVFNRGDRTWRPFAIKAPTAGGATVNLTTVQRYPFLDASRYQDWFTQNPPPGS